MSLKKGDNPSPISIPQLESVIKIVQVKEIYECQFKTNVSKNWLTITSPQGAEVTIPFKDQRGPSYRLRFDVLTGLKNINGKIIEYNYNPIKGGIRDFIRHGIKILEDGTLALDVTLVTQDKISSGKFTVVYETTKTVCTENCPPEATAQRAN